MNAITALQGLAFQSSPATIVSRIYCGRAIPAHLCHDSRSALVGSSGVDRFIDDEVAHRFPDGFTVIEAKGGWRCQTSGKTIREPVVIIEVAHNSFQASLVREIAEAWKYRFQQDAVMVAAQAVTEFV